MLSAHEDATGGHQVHDGRTPGAGREDTGCAMGGHNYVRQTSRGTSSETYRGRKGGAYAHEARDHREERRRNEFAGHAKPLIIR